MTTSSSALSTQLRRELDAEVSARVALTVERDELLAELARMRAAQHAAAGGGAPSSLPQSVIDQAQQDLLADLAGPVAELAAQRDELLQLVEEQRQQIDMLKALHEDLLRQERAGARMLHDSVNIMNDSAAREHTDEVEDVVAMLRSPIVNLAAERELFKERAQELEQQVASLQLQLREQQQQQRGSAAALPLALAQPHPPAAAWSSSSSSPRGASPALTGHQRLLDESDHVEEVPHSPNARAAAASGGSRRLMPSRDASLVLRVHASSQTVLSGDVVRAGAAAATNVADAVAASPRDVSFGSALDAHGAASTSSTPHADAQAPGAGAARSSSAARILPRPPLSLQAMLAPVVARTQGKLVIASGTRAIEQVLREQREENEALQRELLQQRAAHVEQLAKLSTMFAAPGMRA